MHAATAARLGVQRTLEDSSKDGWRNLAPVKVETCIVKQGTFQVVGELRDLYFFGKQAAVGVRECLKIVL